MKGKLRTLTFLILLSLSFNNFQESHSFIQVNDSFIYTIDESAYYAEIGSDKTLFQGYKFGYLELPVGVKVNATITDIDYGDVSFIFQASNLTRYEYLSVNWFDIFILDSSYTTLFCTYNLIRNADMALLAEWYLFTIHPYVNSTFNDYFNSLETLGEDICSFFNQTLYPTIDCSYATSEESGILFFESWVGGKIEGSFGKKLTGHDNYPTDISFGNNMHFAIDKETGIVQGFGKRGWVKGTINNEKVKVSMEFEYVLENYAMNDYQFGNYKDFTMNNLPLILSTSIGIPLLIGISLVTVFIIRRRR
ncbi:MAG: hypothetical protein JXA54_03385 [Candidatus Heimdallarchaeota archaeon]|nr:hypothetical protein [Candidatus Heimdallarchaeota archaeon]